MKSIIILFLLATISCLGQKTKSNKRPKINIDDSSCVWRDKMSFNQRSEMYPYNVSEKVVLATYLQQKDGVVGGEMMSYFNSLKENRSLFDKTRFKDYVEINSSQVGELTNIIFNYGYKKDNGLRGMSGCYMPNNAILFLDKDDNLLEFIEICFDCGSFRASKEAINLGEDCDAKMNLLSEFFISSGIAKTYFTR